MDVAKMKGLLDKHTNVATHINGLTRQMEATQISCLEVDILSQELPVKDIINRLEIKMVKDMCPAGLVP